MSDALPFQVKRPSQRPPGPTDTPLDGPAPADYDALADLFLSDATIRSSELRAPGNGLRIAHEEGDAGSTAPHERPARRVEGLILGHLPVLAAPWVTQYAKHIAETTRERVALFRVQAGQVSIDIIHPRASQAAPQSRVGAVSPDAGAGDLNGAIATAAREATTWLVRVDDHDEPDMLRTPGLSGLTLLTGADEAAVVASYRTIKRLAQVLEEDRGESPALRLAVMGADEPAAAEATAKLQKAAQTFLGREVEVAAAVSKIGGCSTTNLYRAPLRLPLAQLLQKLSSEQHHASVAEPKPIDAVEVAQPPKPQSGQSQAVKASGVLLPVGLTPLRAHCPYARSVRLAVDAAGSLHLIGNAHAGSVDAVSELITAAAWAHDHAELLSALSHGLLAREDAVGPTLHVTTQEPRLVRGLLDTAIRVHLVCRVEVHGECVEVLTAIN